MLSKLEAAHPTKKSTGSHTRPAHTQNQSSVFTKYIGKLKVGPTEQLHLSLGVFGADRPEKGFSVAIHPDPNPPEAIVTEIFSIGSATRHELFLSLANYSDKAITAEVWGM